MPPVHGGFVLPDLSGPGKFLPNRVGNNLLALRNPSSGKIMCWTKQGLFVMMEIFVAKETLPTLPKELRF